jgi:hypothetical protein
MATTDSAGGSTDFVLGVEIKFFNPKQHTGIPSVGVY